MSFENKNEEPEELAPANTAAELSPDELTAPEAKEAETNDKTTKYIGLIGLGLALNAFGKMSQDASEATIPGSIPNHILSGAGGVLGGLGMATFGYLGYEAHKEISAQKAEQQKQSDQGVPDHMNTTW